MSEVEKFFNDTPFPLPHGEILNICLDLKRQGVDVSYQVVANTIAGKASGKHKARIYEAMAQRLEYLSREFKELAEGYNKAKAKDAEKVLNPF